MIAGYLSKYSTYISVSMGIYICSLQHQRNIGGIVSRIAIYANLLVIAMSLRLIHMSPNPSFVIYPFQALFHL
jgi:hypothetical protein